MLDLGMVDLAKVGRMFVYLSLVFSLASAAQYTRLFGEAVEAKDKKLRTDPDEKLGESSSESE